MKFTIALVIFLTLGTCTVQAQLRYGFKTGLNFARLDGPSETDASGKALETFKNTTGFHIGMTLTHRFTDNFGVRGEILYSKKGLKYTFDGPSYRVFRFDGGSIMSTGTAKYLYNVSNAYIDIPILAFARWKDFEISGGPYVSFLVQSIGDGSLTYESGKTVPLNNTIDKVQFNLDYNFRKDDPGAGEGTEEIVVKVDAQNIELPKTIGAYFDYTEDKGSLYNTVDFGLVGGLTYLLSSSLYAGVRLQYGLSDVTNNKVDQYRSLPAGIDPKDFTAPTPSSDKDRNFAIQVSVGFSF